jgi:hypothetical protein
MSKRCTHSPEFKARVAIEAISGRKTIQEIAVIRFCTLLILHHPWVSSSGPSGLSAASSMNQNHMVNLRPDQ